MMTLIIQLNPEISLLYTIIEEAKKANCTFVAVGSSVQFISKLRAAIARLIRHSEA